MLSNYYCILDFVYKRRGNVFLSCFITALLALPRKCLLGVAPAPLVAASASVRPWGGPCARELVITERVQGTEAGLPGKVEEDASRSRAASHNASAEIRAGTCAQRELLCRGRGGNVSEVLLSWGNVG